MYKQKLNRKHNEFDDLYGRAIMGIIDFRIRIDIKIDREREREKSHGRYYNEFNALVR